MNNLLISFLNKSEIQIVLKYLTTLILFVFTIYKFKILSVETMGELKYFTTLSLLTYIVTSYGLNQFLYKIKLIRQKSIFVYAKIGLYLSFIVMGIILSLCVSMFDEKVYSVVLIFYTFTFLIEQLFISVNILTNYNYRNILAQLIYVILDFLIFFAYISIYKPSEFQELLDYLLFRSLIVLIILFIFNKTNIQNIMKFKYMNIRFKYFIYFSSSFAVLTFIGYISNNVDIYLVKYYFGSYLLGLYSFIIMIKTNLLMGSIIYIQKMTPLIVKNSIKDNTIYFKIYRRKGMLAVSVVSFGFLLFYKIFAIRYFENYIGLEEPLIVVCISTFVYTLLGANGTILSLHGMQKYNIYSEIFVVLSIVITIFIYNYLNDSSLVVIVLITSFFWNLGNSIRLYHLLKIQILENTFDLRDIFYSLAFIASLVTYIKALT